MYVFMHVIIYIISLYLITLFMNLATESDGVYILFYVPCLYMITRVVYGILNRDIVEYILCVMWNISLQCEYVIIG